ncbi:MAG: MFS transporter [Deltaproteobacteria bacterium]|nr:MFS transporter [Deltaproteobacteria bacterium]
MDNYQMEPQAKVITEASKIQPNADRGDRFFYGYVLVAVSFLLQIIGWGAYNSFGVFFNPLMNEYGWSRAGISGAVSVSFCMYGLSSIVLGRLNDRVGPRLIMTVSGIFLGVGYLLMSRLTSLWQLYLLYSLLVGIGISGTDVVLLSTIARWFIRLRGRMSGVLKVGSGVGMLVMPLFTQLAYHGLWLADGAFCHGYCGPDPVHRAVPAAGARSGQTRPAPRR